MRISGVAGPDYPKSKLAMREQWARKAEERIRKGFVFGDATGGFVGDFNRLWREVKPARGLEPRIC